MLRKPRSEESNEHKSVDLNAYFIFGAIILVFLLGMYAIFSPGIQNQGNPACGKIVIAADGSTLRANVAPTLQEALYFLVAGKGEEAVIVGNIDQQSYNILMQFGIRTFGGYTGQAKKVISLYRQARISAQSPTPETLPQATMQAGAPAQAAFGAQGMYPGPVYPNAFQGGVGPNCPLPGSGQGFGQQAAMPGLPDGDTIRRNNIVSQVAWGQPQPPADVATNPLWERAALAQQGAVAPQPQGNITWELAAAQQQAAAQQAAMAQQAALAQQPPANVANNPLWERAAAVAPQPQGNITWELAAAQQQAAAQQAALAQQAAVRQAQLAQYIPVGGAQGYTPPSQYPAAQYPQANVNNGFAPVAAQAPIPTAPPIYSNSPMPHANRGNCMDCHQILDAPANNQNAQAAANQMMWNNNMTQDQNSVRAGVGNGIR